MLISVICFCYLALCIALSNVGRKRAIGFKKAFALSIFLTPIVGAIAVYSSEEDSKHFLIVTQYQCPECGFEFTENETYCQLCLKNNKKVKLKAITRKII